MRKLEFSTERNNELEEDTVYCDCGQKLDWRANDVIDADALKSLIAGMAISNKYPANKANALCELIDAQPTAYDTDKVVE